MNYDPLFNQTLDYHSKSNNLRQDIASCTDKSKLENKDIWKKANVIDISDFPVVQSGSSNERIETIKRPNGSNVKVAIFDIPFAGKTDILKYKPEGSKGYQIKGNNTLIELKKDKVHIIFEQGLNTPESLRQRFEQEKEGIIKNIETLKESLEIHNRNLETFINDQTEKRLTELKKDDNFFK